MSTLFLVRHGQASFFAENYDALSDLGQRQSELLGTFWAARGMAFDEVFSGPRERQLDTARIVGESYARAGRPWPQTEVLPGLDEYQAEAVLKQALPELVERHPRIRKLQADVAAAGDRAETLRRFQRLYEVVIDLWSTGQLDLDQVEPWPEFCRRVEQALNRIVAGGPQRRVVAFTSGGPIGVAVARALSTPHDRTLRVAWMVRNASFSEFLFSGPRFTLSTFNSLPHLDEPELLTYR